MKIFTLWGERKGFEGEAPELMVAWDEYSIDANPEGYDEACSRARTSWGTELVKEREITITIPDDQIEAAFGTPTIEGEAA